MSDLTAAYEAIVAAAAPDRFEYALVGGFAVSARTEPRFTRDIDLAVAVNSDAEAENIVRHLGTVGVRLFALVEHESRHRLATARLLHPNDTVIDLLFASSGIEPEIVRAAEPLEIVPGLVLPVSTIGHLMALKALSRDEQRPQDDLDLRALIAVATEHDKQEAVTAANLIEERGFNRNRDVAADLRALLAIQDTPSLWDHRDSTSPEDLP